MDDVIALAERLGAPVDHHLQGQGPDPRRPSARLRRARAQRHAGRELGDERGRPAARVRRLVRQPHRHLPGHPIIQVDIDPLQLGKFHPVEVPVLGRVGVTARALADAARRRQAAPTDQAADVAERWAIWRRREGAAARATTAARGVASAAVFAALTRHAPEDAVIAVDVGNNTYSFGRYFECAARQRGADVRLPRARSGSAIRPRSAPGRRPAASARSSPSPATAASASTWPSCMTAVKHGMNDHPRAAQQRPARQDLQGAARRALGRLADHAQPRLRRVRRALRRARIRVTAASELDAALPRALAHDGPAMVEVMADAELV